jgi:PAS domain S-box-containing protein
MTISNNKKNKMKGTKNQDPFSLYSGNKEIHEIQELMFHAPSDLQLYLNPQGKIIKINKAGIIYSGFKEEEIIGKIFWKLPGILSKKNIHDYLQVFKNTLQGKKTEEFICELTSKTGIKHKMILSTFPVKYTTKIQFIFVNGKDITKQKETEIQDKIILDNINDLVSIIIFSPDPKYYYVNKAHKTLLGYDSKELIGKSIFTHMNKEDFNKLILESPNLIKSISGKNKYFKKIILRFKAKDNSWHSLETTINLIDDKIIAVARDVTKKMQMEKKIIEASNLLKRKDEFIKQMGHDLKNPLGPIINILPILKKSERNLKKKELFNVILRNINYMKNVVVNTLELAKLNSPNIEFSFEKINLLDIINDSIERNMILFQEEDFTIENKIQDDISIMVDKTYFAELLDNIFSNAMKYSYTNDKKIIIDLKEKTDKIIISLYDNGIGMTQEQLSNLFNEFYKADRSHHDFKSTGLGLAICKRIIEQHDGEIWAESNGLNKGTTIFFTIPQYNKNE